MALMTKPSILFVSDTGATNPYTDPSVRYRCFNMAQELVRRGFRSHVIAQHAFETRVEQLGSFDRYVFHRPRLTQDLADFFLGVEPGRAIADFDDLIFDVRYADATPAVRVRKRPAKEVRHYVASMAESVRMLARATVSTEPLAEHAAQFEHLAVSVIHNHLDPAFLGLARELRRSNDYNARPFQLGYFSGSASHDLDLALIAPAIAGFLNSNPGARLLVVGAVAIPSELGPYMAQIRRLSVVSFHALPFVMAQCKKVIAPLESTPFAACKSGLKFFEAALVGCDVIATPIPDMARFRSPLLTMCGGIEEWAASLAKQRDFSAGDLEKHLNELETSVHIGAAVPGWLKAVGLEGA
jgi:glycosyltransferase involved in cell wall biosynthesis